MARTVVDPRDDGRSTLPRLEHPPNDGYCTTRHHHIPVVSSCRQISGEISFSFLKEFLVVDTHVVPPGRFPAGGILSHHGIEGITGQCLDFYIYLIGTQSKR